MNKIPVNSFKLSQSILRCVGTKIVRSDKTRLSWTASSLPGLDPTFVIQF